MAEFTQEDLDAAVAAATKPLEDRISQMLTERGESEVEQRIAEAKAELESKITDLQAQLDTKVLEVEEARKASDDLSAYLQAVAAEQEQAAEIARLREERLATVREVASFPDEYVEANADRWASLPAEAFEALVNDWKAITPAKPETAATTLPPATAMVASRNDNSGRPAFAEVFELVERGADLRTL